MWWVGFFLNGVKWFAAWLALGWLLPDLGDA